MQIPAAEFIEAAQDQLKEKAFSQPGILQDEETELRATIGIMDRLFIEGYLLGVETGRVMVATNTTIRLKGINPEEIL